MSKVSLHTPAPDFSAVDFQGEDVTLSSFQGKNHVFLVFNRGFL